MPDLVHSCSLCSSALYRREQPLAFIPHLPRTGCLQGLPQPVSSVSQLLCSFRINTTREVFSLEPLPRSELGSVIRLCALLLTPPGKPGCAGEMGGCMDGWMDAF